MKRFRSQLLAMCLIGAAAFVGAARFTHAAVVEPSATMTVDGERYSIPVSWNPNTQHYGLGTYDPETGEFSGATWETSEFMATINGEYDPDPQVSYGISVQDFGAPSVFGFFFLSPIILPPGPNTVNSSIAGALNDVNGSGVSITPTLGPNIQLADLGAPATNMGVDVGPAAIHGAAAPGAFYTYGPFVDGPQPGPAGAWTSLSVTLGFSMSGGSDIAVLTGFAQIVPEPSSSVLLGLGGVAVLGYIRRLRRKS